MNILKRLSVYIKTKRLLRQMCFCFVYIATLHSIAFAQSLPKAGVAQQIIYKEAAQNQRITAHINKDFFVTGERIWFNIYISGKQEQPLTIEKTALVEIIGAEQKPVMQAQVLLQNGKGEGALLLPNSVATGKYLFRAYTHALRNKGSAAFFESELTIVNATQRPAWASLKGTKDIIVRCFPEGGKLVYGLQNATALWCTNEYGEAVDVPGFILNQNGDTVARFTTAFNGRTVVNWTPLAGNEYRIAVKEAMQPPKVLLLPIAAEGLGMQVKAADKNYIEVQVKATNAFENQAAFLSIHTISGVKLLQQSVTGGRASFAWAEAEMQEGFSLIKLYDAKGTVQGSLWWYRKPVAMPQIDIQTNAATFESRQEVMVNIAGRQQGSGWASISASVFLTDSLQKAVAANEDVSSLSLEKDQPSSDLFLSTLPTSLSQNGMQGNSFYLPQYEGPLVTARVTDNSNGAAAAGITTYLSLPGSPFQFVTAVSDSNGLAYFNLKSFTGNREAVVQLDKRKDSNYTVQILNPFSDNNFLRPFKALSLTEAWAPQLEQHALAAQVQAAFHNGNAKNQAVLTADTLAFYGVPDKTYLLDDYTRFATLEEVMREYVTEVMVRRRGNSDHYQVYNLPYRQLFDADPLMLIDGVPFFDVAEVMAVDPVRLKKLDIISRRYARGTQTYEGIVSFATYDGNLAGIALRPDAVTTAIAGVLPVQSFESPQYTSAIQNKERIPDQRLQLFWTPYIQTDEKGAARFSFFTSDVPGRYAVVVKGITKDGNVATKTAYINVVKK